MTAVCAPNVFSKIFTQNLKLSLLASGNRTFHHHSEKYVHNLMKSLTLTSSNEYNYNIRYPHSRPIKDWQRIPSASEVECLQKKFEEPEKLVREFMQKRPTVEDCMECVTKRLNVWNAKLTLKWPITLTVCGCGESAELARRNAYLQACSILEDLCMIQSKPGRVINCCQELLQLKSRVHPQKPIFTKNNFISKKIKQGNAEKWSCTLASYYFDFVTTTGEGLTRSEAEENAASKMVLKLRAHQNIELTKSGMLTILPSVVVLPFKSRANSFKPDFTFYVDASQNGYGAYLTQTFEKGQVVRWISQEWPPNVFDRIAHNTAFLEFYAMFSVLFTWKKKFANSQVLAKSDSNSICNMINGGLAVKYTGSTHVYYKAFKMLQETCIKHNITFRAQHVLRSHNIEADLLSKQQLNHFFTTMEHKLENPSFVCKKAKQLLFLKPFGNKNNNVIHFS